MSVTQNTSFLLYPLFHWCYVPGSCTNMFVWDSLNEMQECWSQCRALLLRNSGISSPQNNAGQCLNFQAMQCVKTIDIHLKIWIFLAGGLGCRFEVFVIFINLGVIQRHKCHSFFSDLCSVNWNFYCPEMKSVRYTTFSGTAMEFYTVTLQKFVYSALYERVSLSPYTTFSTKADEIKTHNLIWSVTVKQNRKMKIFLCSNMTNVQNSSVYFTKK